MTSTYGDRSLRSVAIVIAAAGRGERLGGELPKALEQVAGVSLLEYCVHVIAGMRGLGAVVVAAPDGYLADVEEICARLTKPGATVVAGGSTRTESVSNALAVMPDGIDIVLVHDAARAFTPVEQFLDVIAAVEAGADAVIPGLAVVDTIKEVDASGSVLRTVPRDSLRGVQTPQGFRRETLDAVHRGERRAREGDPWPSRCLQGDDTVRSPHRIGARHQSKRSVAGAIPTMDLPVPLAQHRAS